MRNRRSQFVPKLILAPLVLALVMFGMSCSKESPTAPSPPGDDVNALPEVPQPSAPNTTPPAYSASTLVARQHSGDFNPVVSAITGNWTIYVRQARWWGITPPCAGDEVPAYQGVSCCHDLPDRTVTVPGCGLLAAETHTFPLSPTKYGSPQPPWQYRCALLANGNLQVSPMIEHKNWAEGCIGSGTPPTCWDYVMWCVRSQVRGLKLQTTPYLLRERFWERVPLDDQGLVAVWLNGDDSFDVTTTYRSGSDSTATNSFAKTLKVGAEGTFDWLKLSVEATIQKTFSTSVTISASEERSYQKHLVGDAGTITCHTLWSLVDQYRWANASKNLYTDPSYKFVFGGPDPRGRTVEFEIRGQQLYLMKTVFDQSGALERSELVAVR